MLDTFKPEFIEHHGLYIPSREIILPPLPRIVPAFAAFSLIASVGAGSPSGPDAVTTGAIDTTVADLIVICASANNDATTVPTDSKGNTWTALQLPTGGIQQAQFFYCVNPTVGTGHTFSYSNVGSSPTLNVAAFSGSHATPFDQENKKNVSSTTTTQPGSVTPSEDNELVITGICWGGGAETMAIDSSFTISTQVQFSLGNHFGGGMAYKIQTTAGAENPTWSWSGASRPNSAVIATFKAAAVAGGGNPWSYYAQQ